jgi:hypothetical protein
VFLSLLVLITVGGLIAINDCTTPVAWWYQFGFLTLGPASVFVTPVVANRLKGLTKAKQ